MKTDTIETGVHEEEVTVRVPAHGLTLFLSPIQVDKLVDSLKRRAAQARARAIANRRARFRVVDGGVLYACDPDDGGGEEP